MRTLTCHCCGADITAPQFHKGHAYGWTCIKKVAPKQKRTRDNGLWIKADNVEIVKVAENSLRQLIKATVKGVVFKAWFYADPMIFAKTGEFVPQHEGTINIDGLVKIAKYSNGTKPCFKGIEVVQGRNEKGKLVATDVIDTKTGKSLF